MSSIQPTRGFDWWRLLPWYWFQNDPTDRLWDAALNEALDKFPPKKRYLSCEVGPFIVWAANYPYAYGNRYDGKESGLPLVSTRRRLRQMLELSDAEELSKALGRSK